MVVGLVSIDGGGVGLDWWWGGWSLLVMVGFVSIGGVGLYWWGWGWTRLVVRGLFSIGSGEI